MIKIEFPADRRDIAEHLGRALLAIGTGKTEGNKLVVAGVPADKLIDGKVLSDMLKNHNLHNDTAKVDIEGLSEADAIRAGEIADEMDSTGPAFDEKGVPFDAKYCARAKEPFYMSGSMKGQWKKGRGVEQSAYDAWYASQLPVQNSGPVGAGTGQHHDPHSGGSFPATTMFAPADGAAQAVADAAKAFSPEPPAGAPDNAGKLMAWVSAKQAAKVLTQDDINQAYQAAGVQIADLFGANAAQACGAVYSILVQKAGV